LIFKAEHVWSKYVGNLSATVSSPRIFGKCSYPGFVFYTESFALLFCLTLPEKIGLLWKLHHLLLAIIHVKAQEWMLKQF